MTQTALDFQPAERLSLCDKLEAYLRARPNQWIDGVTFEPIAGKYGWRTRVSDLRKKRGMVIENRVRVVPKFMVVAGSEHLCGSFKVSEYRYVPEGQ
jgi:hypothetical protein